MEKSNNNSIIESSGQNKISLKRVTNQNTNTKDLTCSLCDNILPITYSCSCSNCGEQFCKDCLEDHLKKNSTCPECGERFKGSSLSKVVRNLLKDLRIICVNCNQSFSYEDITKHEEECSYRPKRCPGCLIDILVKDYEAHISNCDEFMIPCKKCEYFSCRKDFSHCCNTIKYLSAKYEDLYRNIDRFKILMTNSEREEDLEQKINDKFNRLENQIRYQNEEILRLEDLIKDNIGDKISVFENILHEDKITKLESLLEGNYDEKISTIQNHLRTNYEEKIINIDEKIYNLETMLKNNLDNKNFNLDKGFNFNNMNSPTVYGNSNSFEEKMYKIETNFMSKLKEIEEKFNLLNIKNNSTNLNKMINDDNITNKMSTIENSLKSTYEEKIINLENLLKFCYEDKFNSMKNDFNVELTQRLEDIKTSVSLTFKEKIKKKSRKIENSLKDSYDDKFRNNFDNFHKLLEERMFEMKELLVNDFNSDLKELEKLMKNNLEEKIKGTYKDIKATYGDKIDRLMKKIFYNKEKLMNLKEDSLISGDYNINALLPLEEYDNNCILAGFEKGAIHLYHISTGKIKMTYKEHTTDINDLKYLGYYKRGYFASCCNSKLIKIWDIASNISLKTIECEFFAYRLESLFNFHKNWFLTGDENGHIRIWSIDNETEPMLITSEIKHKSCVFALTHFRNKSPYNLLASGGNADDHTIYLWDLNNLKCLMSYNEHTKHIYAITYYKDDLFLSSSEDKLIKIWSIYQSKSINTLYLHNSDVFSLLIIPEEDILISSSYDRTLKVTDLIKGEILKSYKTTEYMRIVILMKNDKYRVVGGNYWTKNIMVLSINL